MEAFEYLVLNDFLCYYYESVIRMLQEVIFRKLYPLKGTGVFTSNGTRVSNQ